MVLPILNNIRNKYNGNTRLKQVGFSIPYSHEQVQEIIRCSSDPIYFITKYCKIVSLDHGLVPFILYGYQENFIETLLNNRKVISMQPRQMGKSQTVAAFILWYTLFQSNKTVAILANKAPAAREILYRYQLMYEGLPLWLQQGIKTWNKGDIELENGSIVFTAATTASGIRGKSCVTKDTKVCIEINNSIFYTEIENIINNSIFVEIKDFNMKRYAIYKTTNIINKKIYIGFHTITKEELIREDVGFGSCFKSGYLGSGKLLIPAVEKYGPSNFTQEILQIFDTKEEAEEYERLLVNKSFVESDDNYNLSVGGNTCILYGEQNGFYGKTHSPETISKIKESRKKSNLPTFQTKFLDIESGKEYKGYSEVLKQFNFKDIKDGKNIGEQRRKFIAELIKDNKIKLINDNLREHKLLKNLDSHLSKNSTESIKYRKEVLAKNCSDRFKGKKKSESQVKKISESNKKWIEDNPELHKQRMDKINKNPEKIRKTAEKHRNIERTAEWRQNISNSLKGKVATNLGKICAYDPATSKIKYFETDSIIPESWIKGYPPRKKGRKCYTNGEQYKLFVPGEQPKDWILSGPKKKKIS